MKRGLLIILMFSACWLHAQRPDLTIGVNASINHLTTKSDSSMFISPGIFVHAYVSKRFMLVGAQLGYWAALSYNNSNYTPQHHFHGDIVAGAIIIRKLAAKLGVNAIISNNILLSSIPSLNSSYLFSRFSLQVLPEIYLKYKYLRFGFNYKFPLLGTPLHGPGFNFGVNF